MILADPDGLTAPGMSSSPYLHQLDVVPLEASLQRLYNAKINAEEEHQHDYAILQAVRGVLYSAKSPRAFFAPPHAIGAEAGGAAEVKGAHLALYRLALGSLQSAGTLRTSSYLSCRLLCDDATHYGEGNDCPCCTEEWVAALLFAGRLLSPKHKVGSAGNGDAAFSSCGTAIPFAVNRKFHLGYLLLTLDTLRTVATGGVTGKQLSSHYTSLLQGWVDVVLPALAVLAEEQPAATAFSAAGADGGAPPPTRLTVEANHAVVHSLHWISVDILHVHAGGSASLKGKRVLDRDFPPRLWGCLGMLRRALDRAFTWLKQEMVRQHGCAPKDVVLVDTAMQSYQWMFDDMSKKYDQMGCACRAARQQYGDSAKAVAEITDLMWVQTMRLCLLIRDVTGSWVATQGGLCLSCVTSGVVLFQYKDVVAYAASALAHVTGAEGKESEFELFVSSNAFLVATVAVAAAAPSTGLQEALWFSETAMTEQIHHLLIQRGLRFRDEHVLQMASALSSSILYSSSSSSGSAVTPHANLSVGFAEQLMGMLAQDRDAASHHITRMLTLAVVERPYALIPQLFQLLQQNNTAARRNALDVLAALPNCGEKSGDAENGDGKMGGARGGSAQDPRMRETLRILAEHLIMRLHDEELCVRMQSASLFAKVDPEDVVEPLLCVNLQRDNTGRKQSVSQRALEAVLRAHTRSAAVMLLLLTTAFNILHRDTGEKLTSTQQSGGGGSAAAAGGDVVQDGKEMVPDQQTEARQAPMSLDGKKTGGSTSLTATPADLYSRALLYSTEPMLGESEESAGGQEGVDPSLAGSASTNNAEGKPKVDFKASKMNYLLQSLCEVWVKEACEGGSLETSLAELLRAAKNAPADSLEARQWYIKYTTQIISDACAILCANPAEGSALVLRVVCSQLLLQNGALPSAVAAPGSTEQITNEEEEGRVAWLAAIRTADTLSPGKGADSAFDILLPLLCLRACDASFFGEKANPELSDLVWRCVWVALLDDACLSYMHRNREIQRVLLEVLCRFPSQRVFGRLAEERAAHAELRLFLDRVMLFCLCYYASGALQSGAAPAGATAVVDEASLSYLVQHTVPDLVTANVAPYESSKYYTEAEWHKFALSALEAMALLLLLSVSSSSDTAVARLVGEQRIFGPTRELAALYRDAKKAAASAESALCPPQREAMGALQHKVAFSLQVNNQALQIIERHPQGRALYLQWYTQFARACVELCNASCAYVAQVGSSSEGAPDVVALAAECCEILFRAVLLSSKLLPLGGGRQVPSSESVETAAPTSLLQKLPLDEKEALLSFAIGTTRYAKVPRMQQTGVRLLSGIMGAAPDLFAEVDTDGQMHVLNDAVAALQSIAVMFSHTPTRLLAEQVLNVFSQHNEK